MLLNFEFFRYSMVNYRYSVLGNFKFYMFIIDNSRSTSWGVSIGESRISRLFGRKFTIISRLIGRKLDSRFISSSILDEILRILLLLYREFSIIIIENFSMLLSRFLISRFSKKYRETGRDTCFSIFYRVSRYYFYQCSL